MKRALGAPVLSGMVLCCMLVASSSSAQTQDRQSGELGVTNVFGVVILAANTVTSIGTAVQLSRPDPRLGWGISAIVTGGMSLAGSAAMIPLAIEINNNATGDIDPKSGWLVVGPALFLSTATLLLGIINTVRAGSSRAALETGSDAALAVVPTLTLDKEKRPAVGLGLQLTEF